MFTHFVTILINSPKDEYNALDFLTLTLLTNVSSYKCKMQGLNVTAYIFAEKCVTNEGIEHTLVSIIIFLTTTLFLFNR
jgi:hypothetical protein